MLADETIMKYNKTLQTMGFGVLNRDCPLWENRLYVLGNNVKCRVSIYLSLVFNENVSFTEGGKVLAVSAEMV